MAHFHRMTVSMKKKAPPTPKIDLNEKVFPKSDDPGVLPDVPPPRPNFPFDGIENLKAPLLELDSECLGTEDKVSDKELLGMKGFKRLATYNWIRQPDQRYPVGTMVIPGAPRIIDTNVSTVQLKQDDWIIAHPNGYQSPNFSLEPVFRAIEECQGQGSFDSKEYDIMADSNVIQLLCKFCYESSELNDKPFRIDVRRYQNMVVFLRYEESTVFKYTHKREFGLDFKAKVTKTVDNDLLTRGNFQQVITYQFGKYKMLITSQVHCCKGADDKTNGATKATQTPEPQPYENGSRLRVIRYGALRPFELAELATREVGGLMKWDSIWQRVFFTGAKALVVGRINMDTGELVNVQRAVLPRLPPSADGEVEEDISGLRKTHYVLRKIVDFVRKRPDGKYFAIILQPGKSIKIYDRDGSGIPAVLPKPYQKRILEMKAF
uniref:Decapping nuclease n=1 Tax=Plectus sambesii TaxID=2011161 RepID=A0A914X4X4_9BILA